MAAARRLLKSSSGRAAGSDLTESAGALNLAIPPEMLAALEADDPDRDYQAMTEAELEQPVWPEHVDAVRVFSMCADQKLLMGAGMKVFSGSLDVQAIEAAMRMLKVRRRTADVFRQVRTMEAELG